MKKTNSMIIFGELCVAMLLSQIMLASAAQSAEQIVVRVQSYDPSTREYTFSCDIPGDANPSRYWTVRPDTPALEHSTQSTSRTFIYQLNGKVLYHIGCQVQRNGVAIRGDFHIDRRNSVDSTRPNVVALSTNGLQSTLGCDYTAGSNYNLYWNQQNSNNDIALTQYNNQKQITVSAPNAGLWDYSCGIWDLDKKSWTQFALPIEFFSSGEAYVPNINGCIPGESCAGSGSPAPSPSTQPSSEPTPQSNTSRSSSCATSIDKMPVVCEGGSIASDTFNGCRQVKCTSGSSSITVLGCDKPSSSSPQHFELYKQGQTGSQLKVCFGSTCISDSGFAKSGNYPICSSPQPAPQQDPSTSSSPPNQSQGTCYASLDKLPASCTSGSVTQDLFNGCRKITCTNGASSKQILACNKPDIGAPQFFEMYLQTQTGQQLGVCLGGTCLTDSGYSKGGNYPVCTGSAQPAPQQPQPSTPPSTCYSGVRGIPATCNGGTIIQDTYDGCRHITCASDVNNLQVLACDKPDSTPSFFEMYKQSQTGNAQICLAGTCIKEKGFAQSGKYPVCISESLGTGSGAATPQPVPSGNHNTNQNNQPPAAPSWIEPSGNVQVDTFDFHINVNQFADAENDGHLATDFELWDATANQRIWSSLYNTRILYHIHNADGKFEGNLAGKDRLLYDHDYKLRARFHENAQFNNVSTWSEWRNFHTKPFFNSTNSKFIWTARQGYTVDLVAEDVNVPVNVGIAPDKYAHLPFGQRPHLYVTQLYGQIGMIRNDGSYVKYADNLLNYQTFGSLPGSGETGVDGLYIDPSGDLFVSMVYADDSAQSGFKGKIVRFRTNANGDGYTSTQTILSNIPVSPSHHVHTITRGPDGKLYLNTGDADSGQAQVTSSMAGKVLRFNDDGSIPGDNPVQGSYFWAGGFRNPFGGAWRPGTSEFWVSNNGPDEDDGIYKVARANMFGWCCNTSIGTWHLWHETTAPVQLVFDNGNSGFPADSAGSFYVGLSGSTYAEGASPNAKRIVQFKINPDGSKQSVQDLVTYTGNGYGAPIGLAFGNDGLYFTDLYGEAGFVGVAQTKGNIYRIHPGDQSQSTLINQPQEFSAGLSPAAWYPQEYDMVWDCKGIGGSGQYHFDYFFGDGNAQYNVQGTVWHTYPQVGTKTYTASCTVYDDATGKTASTSTQIVLPQYPQERGG
ncbi:MAG TPA: PQQ-dependent sugar dehydrogenase [Candidatus Nanoarchaeia archaeon]|nr:PQQ-dependent sugar dehydrogenase [Candidatus Nanoarchaeia archaeon]